MQGAKAWPLASAGEARGGHLASELPEGLAGASGNCIRVKLSSLPSVASLTPLQVSSLQEA